MNGNEELDPAAAQAWRDYDRGMSALARQDAYMQGTPHERAAIRRQATGLRAPEERPASSLSGEFLLPQTPLDYGLMALGGPLPRAAKTAAVGMGALFEPREAEAGPISKIMKGIRAYHGSPQDFDKFDISKIGTGEGAQAYGHGLYFAENERVAKAYRDALKWKGSDWENPQFVASFWKDHYKGDLDQAIKHLEGAASQQSTQSAQAAVRDAITLLRNNAQLTGSANPGRMYEVNINARPEQFLDWDRPIVRQSPEIQATLDRLAVPKQTINYYVGPNARPTTGEEAYRALEIAKHQPGRGHLDRQVASDVLRDAGIPGIRYLDQGSRGSQNWIARHPQGGTWEYPTEREARAFLAQNPDYVLEAPKATSNYVVFDDKLIDILRKYGLAGLTAGGVGMGALAAQDQYEVRP